MPIPVVLLIILAGCAASEGKFYRVDGQPIASHPANLQQAELDRTICLGAFAESKAIAPERNDIADVRFKACMAQRGYVWRP